jgi:hypothetical protein
MAARVWGPGSDHATEAETMTMMTASPPSRSRTTPAAQVYWVPVVREPPAPAVEICDSSTW